MESYCHTVTYCVSKTSEWFRPGKCCSTILEPPCSWAQLRVKKLEVGIIPSAGVASCSSKSQQTTRVPNILLLTNNVLFKSSCFCRVRIVVIFGWFFTKMLIRKIWARGQTALFWLVVAILQNQKKASNFCIKIKKTKIFSDFSQMCNSKKSLKPPCNYVVGWYKTNGSKLKIS